MLGEIFAYYFGRSVGRQQGYRRRKFNGKTADEIALERLVAIIVAACVLAVVIASLLS